MPKGIWNQPGATERFLLYGTVDHAAIIYEHDAITHVPGWSRVDPLPAQGPEEPIGLSPPKCGSGGRKKRPGARRRRNSAKKTIAYKDLLRWNPAWGSELRRHRQGVAIMSTHGVDVFVRSLQTTRQWLHELESVV